MHLLIKCIMITYAEEWQLKAKEERVVKVLKIMFGIMFLSVIGAFVMGEVFMPVEDPTESGECVLYEAEWERVIQDGTREKVELPGRCAAERGEVVRLEALLPDNQDDTWLCMRASQQDMRVLIGDEIRKEYSTKESRLFGRNSASAFVFFEISEEDAGKVLAIELISDSEYAGFLNEVYEGDKYDIAYLLLKQCAVVLFVSFYMLILSSITVLIGCILKFFYRKKIDITYLGLGIMQLSINMITESRIRQFFLPNVSIAAHVGFLMTILLPYPFMVYVNRVQKGRYEKFYKALSVCVAANFIISVLLQVLNILGLEDTMVVSYGMVIIMLVIMSVTIVLDMVKGRIGEYGEIVYGFIAMIIVVMWEMYITFVPESPYPGGVALSFGLIILLFMAGFKTAKDILSMEKEKQMAIAAGEAKEKFIANMSHEIRTPINTIIGMNEMILRESEDESMKEYARNVQSASKLLLGLINDVLDFSKIEAGKMDILTADYNLSRLLTDAIEGIRIRAERKNITLNVEVEETLPSVFKGDEIRIRQILNNLLSNAVKYTEDGYVTLRVRGIYAQDEFALCISVEDTGIGIKPEDLNKLFGSFQRLEENKNRYIEGTGLGLNITRQLVSLMGGRIDVKSDYGNGSCFTVYIPQQIIDSTAIGKLEDAYKKDTAVREEFKSKLYAPGAEVLVVDDNEMNLAVVNALLKRTGINLTMAHGGAECLELCKNKKYDLILMDHMMPKPDGIETLHILRKNAGGLNHDTDVIVLTANAIAGMAEKYIEEGFNDYLSKPILAEDLENMLCKYLKGAEIKDTARDDSSNSDKTDALIGSDDKKNTVIDKKLGLQYCANNEDMYKEMASVFSSQGEKYINNLSQYYEAHDWQGYKIIAHALKSTSLVIGAAAFSEHAKKLEAAAKEGNEEVLLAEGEAFLEEYKIILDLLKKQ